MATGLSSTPNPPPRDTAPLIPPQVFLPIGGAQRHVEPQETQQLSPQEFVDASAPQQQQLREATEAGIRHSGCVGHGHRCAGPVWPVEKGSAWVPACEPRGKGWEGVILGISVAGAGGHSHCPHCTGTVPTPSSSWLSPELPSVSLALSSPRLLVQASWILS